MTANNTLTAADRDRLRYAVTLLENPSFAARLSNVIGKPLETAFLALPNRWSGGVQRAVRLAVEKALDMAVRTLDADSRERAADNMHKALAGVSGAVGGFFGAPALVAELPISTAIIVRSITDIARSEGENINDIGTRLACLEVLALGGASGGDDSTETGYFAIRSAMSTAVSEAARYLAQKGGADVAAPALARLVALIAARFGVVVSEKFAAQAVPILGAIGGATINLIFIDHFQDMARAHFIVRNLERRYGEKLIATEYARLKATR